MSNGVNNTVGDVSLKMGVDSSTVSAEAKAAAEKANAAAEEALVKQVNARDAALRARQQQVIAGLKRESEEIKAASEKRQAAIFEEAVAAKEAFKQIGEAKDAALADNTKAVGGIKGINKALSDSVGQVQALIGKFAIISGVATGMFALGRAIRESVVEALKDGTKEAEKFAESVNSFTPKDRLVEYEKQIKDVEAALAQARADQEKTFGSALVFVDKRASNRVQRYTEELRELNLKAETERKAIEAKRVSDQKLADKNAADQEERLQQERFAAWEEWNIQRLLAEQNALDERNAAELVAYRKLQNERIDASAEYNKAVEDALTKQELEQEAFSREMKDFYAEMTEEAAKAARKTQQTWEASFRAIREASNAAFNTDNARSMVELAGNLNQTATTATANMNRIIVGGTD